MFSRIFVVWMGGFLCLWPGVSSAAGFFLLDRGLHPMSRAGAAFGGGDTLQTIWYNPANLAEFTGFSALVDVGVIHTQADFQRASRVNEEGKTIDYQKVSNESPPIPPPSLLAAYGWKSAGVTLGFGVYAPYASSLKFPETGPQRYALIDMTGSLFLTSHLAVAWSPHPRFRVGAGIQNLTVSVRLYTASSAYLGLFGAPEDPNLDLYTEARLEAPFNITGNVGVWGRLVDQDAFKLDLGISAQMPAFIQGRGAIRVRLPSHPLFDPASIEGSEAKASFWLPLVARAGLRFTFVGRADIEAAFVYEGWSLHKEIGFSPTGAGIKLRNVPTIGDYQVPAITIRRDFQDAFSIRLGGSITLVPSLLSLQLGYAFESTAIPNSTFTVFLMDSDKHIAAVGFSFFWKKMRFDIAYVLTIQPQREITGSQFRQLNLLNPEGATTIGDGAYNSMIHTAGLSWNASF